MSRVYLTERDVRFDLALAAPADSQAAENEGRFRLVLSVSNHSTKLLVIPIGRLELQVSDADTGLVIEGKKSPTDPHLASPAPESLKLAPGSADSILIDGLRSYGDGGSPECLQVDVLGKRWYFQNPDYFGMNRAGKPDSVVVTFDNTSEAGSTPTSLSPVPAAVWTGKLVLPPLNLSEIKPLIPMMGPIF